MNEEDSVGCNKVHVGGDLYAWHCQDRKKTSLLVEEHGDVVELVRVTPKGSLRDKDALKAIRHLYPGKQVLFARKFNEMKEK